VPLIEVADRVNDVLDSVDAPEIGEAETAKALERLEARAQDKRSLFFWDDVNGAVGMSGFLPSVAGAQLRDVIAAIVARPRPSGEDPNGDDRSAPQKRADALAEVIDGYLRSGDAPVFGGDRVRVAVTVDFDTLCGAIATPPCRTGHRSARARPADSHATPASSPRFSAPAAFPSTSDTNAGYSARSCARHSCCAIEAVASPDVKRHRRRAKATTSNPGGTTGPPHCTTAHWCARITIGSSNPTHTSRPTYDGNSALTHGAHPG
jgi:Domain of unknown function (DUF222)